MPALKSWFDGLFLRAYPPQPMLPAHAPTADPKRIKLVQGLNAPRTASRAGERFSEGLRLGLGVPTPSEVTGELGSVQQRVAEAAEVGIRGPRPLGELLSDIKTSTVEGVKGLGELAGAAIQHPREAAGAISRAAQADPAGTAGFTLGTIIPLRPFQFLRGRRIHPALSYPAELAKGRTFVEFEAALKAPAKKLWDDVHASKPEVAAGGEVQIGIIRDYIGNPDLIVHLPAAILDRPVIATSSLRAAAAVAASGGIVSPILINSTRIPTAGRIETFKHGKVPLTPESFYQTVFLEELLHNARAASPGTSTARTSFWQSRPHPTGGWREFGDYPSTGSNIPYYEQNAQERAVNRALASRRFDDFTIPSDDLLQKSGFRSLEDFHAAVNSPGFKQAPTFSTRQLRNVTRQEIKQAVAPQPFILKTAPGKSMFNPTITRSGAQFWPEGWQKIRPLAEDIFSINRDAPESAIERLRRVIPDEQQANFIYATQVRREQMIGKATPKELAWLFEHFSKRPPQAP